jgi:hypothetical protein
MPKIKKPPPRGVLDHLIRRFRTGILAGEGERPSTFLAPDRVVEGEEIE